MIKKIITIIILFKYDLINCYLKSTIKIQSTDYTQPSVGDIWPHPKFIEKFNNFVFIDPNNFDFLVVSQTCYILEQALKRYKKIIQLSSNSIIRDIKKEFSPSQLITRISVNLTTPCERYPHLNMDEWYFVAGVGRIQANSIWGMLRGLETYSQLITPGSMNMLQVRHVEIYDSPRFRYRGLLLDTSRHYISINKILNIIDGMAYNKLNVFHWHIIDDESFPYQSLNFPKLSEKGAYKPRMIYTQDDILNIIEYARLRGIRVVPDFDIFVLIRAFIRNKIYIMEANNIDDNYGIILNFLENFYSEVLDIFPDNFIHLGHYITDNINLNKNLNKTLDDLDIYYNLFDSITAFILQKGFTPIVWQTEMEFINLQPQIVIQLSFRNIEVSNAIKFTDSGYRVIKSDCWLLNDLDGHWDDYYKCEQVKLSYPRDHTNLFIGGEALMWTKNVNDIGIIPIIFPKLSAIAEKLWSPYYMPNIVSAANRIEEHICRLNMRGVNASPALGPGICG